MAPRAAGAPRSGAATVGARFGPRPVLTVVDQLADAVAWPRSRPVRIVAGERAQLVERIVLCADETALDAPDVPVDAAVVLLTPASSSGGRAGKRRTDPFLGDPAQPLAWRRAEQPLLDASLLLAGGRHGVDERIAHRAGIEPLDHGGRLLPARHVPRDVAKLVGYVPTDAAEQVRDAVFAAGAGTIGDYDRCSWSVTGMGTFRGGEGTDPAVGTRGEFEHVEEVRFETVVPTHLIARACRAFAAAHPYEEPAFDVVPLALPAEVGFGRVGRLGPGGGGSAWSALGEIDPELAAYGRVDHVPAGAVALVYSGPMRDVLASALEHDDLGLVVAGAASDAELDLLHARGVAVLVLDRVRAVEHAIGELAALLSRALTMPVTTGSTLRFPQGERSMSEQEFEAARADASASSDAAEPVAASAASWPASSPAPGETAALFDAAATSIADPAQGRWRLHFDGGSRGNPGPAAYGWVLYAPSGEEYAVAGVKVGRATNNVAEWTGLMRGLEHAADLGVRDLEIRGDSELVVKQVKGVYRVKNADLKPIAEQVKELLRRFDRTDIAHVYRSDNARADELANEAMDGLR